jgi:hypothetical protein
MFLTALLITALAVGAALILYVDYLSESTLRTEIKGQLPDTQWAEVENIVHEYGKEYGTTYKLKAHQRSGSNRNVEVRCKNSSISRYAKIYV